MTTTAAAITTTNDVRTPTIDAGVALHSPSTELMKLVTMHTDDTTTATTSTASDFTTITNYIEKHLYDIIHEIHHTYDKLLIDDGRVQINCPPLNPDADDIYRIDDTKNHHHPGNTLLLRTLSETPATNGNGIVAKREIKVYDCGPDETERHKYRTILIREDIVQASNNVNDTHPVLTEQSATIRIAPPKKF